MRNLHSQSGDAVFNLVFVAAVAGIAYVVSGYYPAYSQKWDLKTAIHEAALDATRQGDDAKIREDALARIHKAAPDIKFDEDNDFQMSRDPRVTMTMSLSYTTMQVKFPFSDAPRETQFTISDIADIKPL